MLSVTLPVICRLLNLVLYLHNFHYYLYLTLVFNKMSSTFETKHRHVHSVCQVIVGTDIEREKKHKNGRDTSAGLRR